MLCAAGAVSAGPIGELNISLGGMFPQGNYARYTDPGFTLDVRATFHIPKVGFAAGWVDASLAFFGSDESFVEVVDDPYIKGADQTVSEWTVSLHGGLQFGVDTRRGFFRPRAALGPGLYLFQTDTRLEVPGMEEPLSSESEGQLRFGWRGVAGVDLFFVTKWGLSFDFTYDHVLGLDHVDEYLPGGQLVRTARTARYQSYMVGITIPFETMGEGP